MKMTMQFNAMKNTSRNEAITFALVISCMVFIYAIIGSLLFGHGFNNGANTAVYCIACIFPGILVVVILSQYGEFDFKKFLLSSVCYAIVSWASFAFFSLINPLVLNFDGLWRLPTLGSMIGAGLSIITASGFKIDFHKKT
jgi:drug/metabolite transporter (DMT)-like permease